MLTSVPEGFEYSFFIWYWAMGGDEHSWGWDNRFYFGQYTNPDAVMYRAFVRNSTRPNRRSAMKALEVGE